MLRSCISILKYVSFLINKTSLIRGGGLIEAGAYFCFWTGEVHLKGMLIRSLRLTEEVQYFSQKSLSCPGNDSHKRLVVFVLCGHQKHLPLYFITLSYFTIIIYTSYLNINITNEWHHSIYQWLIQTSV